MPVLSSVKMKLSDPAVFWTIQGEGHLTGQGMVFVRFAGCSVGCANCDTDYSAKFRFSTDELVGRILSEFPARIQGRNRWVWITGGEPTDRDLRPFVSSLSDAGLSVALATSGIRPVRYPVDWLSVSPHSVELSQTFGNEIKLVPGLNGLDAEHFIEKNESNMNFWLKFFQPLDGDDDSMRECVRLWKKFPDWGITIQTHKVLELL